MSGETKHQESDWTENTESPTFGGILRRKGAKVKAAPGLYFSSAWRGGKLSSIFSREDDFGVEQRSGNASGDRDQFLR
jgi:hypothetical protein